MTLTDALLLLAFLIANMVCGAVAMLRYAQVSAIVAQSHPDTWVRMQGLAARGIAGRFYCSLAPFRLKDPELSRALIRAWIATGVWVVLGLTALATATLRAA